MSQENPAFISAEWRDLVMLNYAVDPALLKPHVPAGTVLDSFGGRTYVSLVAFRFLRTKLFGALPIPFHSDFAEVNLRFYVRRNDRRGVVFIAEIVPKWAVAKVARVAFEENYVALPMRYRVDINGGTKTAEYEWQVKGAWCKIHARASAPAVRAEEGSLEQFITEHYWGYSAMRNGDSIEYQVSHVPWCISSSTLAGFEGDASALYGADLGRTIQRQPDSAFIAEGSPVIVHTGRKMKGER